MHDMFHTHDLYQHPSIGTFQVLKRTLSRFDIGGLVMHGTTAAFPIVMATNLERKGVLHRKLLSLLLVQPDLLSLLMSLVMNSGMTFINTFPLEPFKYSKGHSPNLILVDLLWRGMVGASWGLVNHAGFEHFNYFFSSLYTVESSKRKSAKGWICHIVVEILDNGDNVDGINSCETDAGEDDDEGMLLESKGDMVERERGFVEKEGDWFNGKGCSHELPEGERYNYCGNTPNALTCLIPFDAITSGYVIVELWVVIVCRFIAAWVFSKFVLLLGGPDL
ncbi:hypothetical protein VNO78_27405 [Psophocarpus tetragonolobus]|uniref:Uncharacterized protein n=1 Tax=Psophocarpus tetragonolobus TaxID=3891 RepID=A0AAN9XAL1_PSOTE